MQLQSRYDYDENSEDGRSSLAFEELSGPGGEEGENEGHFAFSSRSSSLLSLARDEDGEDTVDPFKGAPLLDVELQVSCL